MNQEKDITDKIELFNTLFPKIEYNFASNRISPRFKIIYLKNEEKKYIWTKINLIKN